MNNLFRLFYSKFKVSKMGKKYFATSLILFLLLVIFLSLNFSNRFNNFIFSNVINPYDPLKVNKNANIKEKIVDQGYWKDPRGIFPIFAYNTPDSSKDLVSSLQIIADGGINIIINANLSWMPFPNQVKEAFKKLGNSNLMWLTYITNECRDDYITGNTNDKTNKHIQNYLKEFDDNFVYGWYIWDEPGSNRKPCSPLNLFPNDDNADINIIDKQIRSDSTFNKKLDFINLFPSYWSGTPTFKKYANYVDTFMSSQEFKPRVLCFDNYPLLKAECGDFRKDYYANLEIIREKSLEYNIPFWNIVLSSEHLSYKNPSFEEISLQVYSALAYGAKGIGYYLYSKSWENVGYKSWILENYVDNTNVADSLHGRLYLPVKILNRQIQALGKTLLDLESTEVIHSSNFPNGQKDISQSVLSNDSSNSFIKNIININDPKSDPKVLIGIFRSRINRNDNGTYLLVVNKNVVSGVNVEILLNNVMNINKFNKENGEPIFLYQNDLIKVSILPGSGELFYTN